MLTGEPERNVEESEYAFKLLLFCLICISWVAPFAAFAQDGLEELLEVYDREGREKLAQSLTPEERQRYYEDKLNVFLNACALDKTSPYYTAGLQAALGLANSCGDYDISAWLAQELLTFHGADWEWQTRWRNELAEIEYIRFRRSEDHAHRQASMDEMRKVHELSKEHLPAILENELDAQRYVANTNRMAELLSESSDGTASAAELYKQMRLLTAEAPSQTREALARLNYDIEHFASKEMRQFYALGDFEAAESALEAIAKQSTRRWPVSYYVNLGSKDAFPEGGTEYQAYVSNWIAHSQPDEWMPYLLYKLGTDYAKSGNKLQAYEVFCEIWKVYGTDLMAKESAKLRPGEVAGHSPEILANVVELALGLELYQAAEEYLTLWSSLFPSDRRCEHFSRYLEDIKADDLHDTVASLTNTAWNGELDENGVSRGTSDESSSCSQGAAAFETGEEMAPGQKPALPFRKGWVALGILVAIALAAIAIETARRDTHTQGK